MKTVDQGRKYGSATSKDRQAGSCAAREPAHDSPSASVDARLRSRKDAHWVYRGALAVEIHYRFKAHPDSKVPVLQPIKLINSVPTPMLNALSSASAFVLWSFALLEKHNMARSHAAYCAGRNRSKLVFVLASTNNLQDTLAGCTPPSVIATILDVAGSLCFSSAIA